jgi:threonine/homoserine/homoserine lactone efflux protein
MPGALTLGTFALASFLIELTPGPNMAWLVLLTLSEGRRPGFAAVLGVALGLAVVGVAAAFGLAALIANSPVLWHTLRWAGVAFLLWLAWEGWRGAEEDDGASHRMVPLAAFRRGLVTNLLNPKAALFYVAVVPGFVEAGAPPLPQALILSSLYVAVATAIHAGLVVLAGAVRPIVLQPRRERIVRRVLSALLALVALWFAVKTGQ